MLAVDYQMSLLVITGHNIRSSKTLNGNVWKSDSPESLCNPRLRRPIDPWTKASQLFADKSQDLGETIKSNWEASNNKNEWMTWITQPGQLLQSRRLDDRWVPCLVKKK